MRPKDVISKYGRCLELISMDPYFNDVTVGLFFKEPLLTVHSYSKIEGLETVSYTHLTLPTKRIV